MDDEEDISVAKVAPNSSKGIDKNSSSGNGPTSGLSGFLKGGSSKKVLDGGNNVSDAIYKASGPSKSNKSYKDDDDDFI